MEKKILRKKYLQIFLHAFLLVTASACATQIVWNSNDGVKPNPREYQIGAYLWLQTSGEYRALTYQAYNLARALVESDLENKHNKKRAVVFDIDETILDNSYAGANEIKNGQKWRESLFTDWARLKKAIGVPGALEFIQFLTEKKVEVILISNRQEAIFEETYANLLSLGFPIKRENLLLKKDGDESKESRRREVSKKFDIILLVGDNLSDFHQSFEKIPAEKRSALVDQLRMEFGQKYIILPNPLYGDWERALPADKSKIELLKLAP